MTMTSHAIDGSDKYAQMSVVPRRGRLRYLGVAIVLLLLALLLKSVATNANFGWHVVGHYLFDSSILRGLRTTLLLTGSGMGIAFVLGLILAVMRLSSSFPLQAASAGYVWFFRGTPVLVQLLFWYNLGALYPNLSLHIPFGPTVASAKANTVFTPWVAALLGLALNEAAYLSEIIRSGITAVDSGQVDAARALGMRRRVRFRRIVLPQALRVMVPPVSNEAIGMLKYSSIVSVIALPELLYSGQLIYARTFQTIPLLLVVSIWYLVVTSFLTVVQGMIERRLGVGWAQERAGGAPATRERGRWRTWWATGR